MTTPIYVDHADLAAFSDAVAATAKNSPAAQLGQRFWSTPERPASSTTADVLELTLASPRLVNLVSFDLARYPQTWALQYFDEQAAQWRPVRLANKTPAGSSILQSNPAVLPHATQIPGHLHPQHSYQGHWERIELVTRPVEASRFRLVLTRTTTGHAPRDAFGKPVDYSLAVANLNLGYRIDAKNKIPRNKKLPASQTAHDSFASTDDILGSTIDFSLRQLPAQIISDNSASSADTVWRCEAQPYADAVVCFYADVRDNAGRAQVIDRIYIDPLYQGPHLTVYYSDATPVGEFDAGSERLSADQARPSDDVHVHDGLLDFGPDGSSGFVTLDNSFLRYDPSQPWWLGLSFVTPFTSFVADDTGMATLDDDGNIVYADLDEHVLFDAGVWRLSIAGGGLSFTAMGVDTLTTDLTFQGGQTITLLLSWDGSAYTLHASTTSDDQSVSVNALAPIPDGDVATLYLGSDAPVDTLITQADGSEVTVSQPSRFACIQLASLALKQELLSEEGFLTAPQQYSALSTFADDELPQTRNALLRLDVSDISAAYPTGLVGGPASQYEAMAWTPIARDYAMLRGWLNLPPTKARYFKFEITDLVAEYRDIYQPVRMTAKKFPAAVLDAYQASLGGGDNEFTDGLPLQMRAADVPLFTDTPSVVSTGGTTSGISNTEVYVASDHQTAERMQDRRGSTWNYRGWHNSHTAPRFPVTAVHTYRHETLTSNLKLAYYAGLRRIAFARQAGAGLQDTPVYDDAFFDTANLRTASWIYDTDVQALTSGDGDRAVAQSITYGSQRRIRGVQFATQQSQARQLLPDPEFTDPTVSTWRPVGDATLPSQVPVQSQQLGTLLPVSRDSQVSRWGDIGPVYHTWDGLTAGNGVTYGSLATTQNKGLGVGGITSVAVPQPTGGRLYAAARVISQDSLGSPLYVQIVDSVTGDVLAEAKADVRADQVTEWYCGYDVGDGGVVDDVHDWADMTGGSTATRATLHDAFARANAASLGRMDSGQYWAGSNPLHLVGNTAQVTALGQESVMDPGNDWGTWSLTFGACVTTTVAASSVPLLGLGGLHVMNDGRVLDASNGAVLATVPRPGSGDVWTLQFCPTRFLDPTLLPAGVDPTVKEWSVVIIVNGGSPTTISRAAGLTRAKSLLGALGQTYTAMGWTPGYQDLVTAPSIIGLPMPTDGGYSTEISTLWVTSTGQSWTVSEPFTVTVNGASADHSRSAVANWATGDLVGRIGHDVGAAYGSFEFVTTQLAPSVAPSAYWIAGLDSTLALRADGALVNKVDGSVVQAGVCPGISNGSRITVKYAHAQNLSPAFRATWNVASTDTQALVFLRDGTVLGVHSGTPAWNDGVREIYGFTDGTHYTVTTGWAWTPDISELRGDVRAVTWDVLSPGGSKTWDQLGDTTAANTHPIVVRVVQKTAARNTYFVDTISLYHDPIVWEWSNDGGKTFVPGFGVRNDPNGVVLFPPPDPSDPAPVENKLVYRLSAYAPGVWVAHLTIRPWYVGYPRGVPARPLGSYQGPNLDPWEHYPPIERDPRFQLWHKPIPRNWWFAFRQLDPSDDTNPYVAPILTDNVVIM